MKHHPPWLLLAFAFFFGSLDAETIPPPPAAFFNDYAHVVPAEAGHALNERLAQFERDTSNQMVVAVFPRMDSDSSVEDYTVRIAQSWGVGQKVSTNGAVLFVFVAEHRVYIQVGYGLEGALTDALCRIIIEREIKPRFRVGDFAGGLDAGVNAIMAATRGEYQGQGRTDDENQHANGAGKGVSGGIVMIFVLLFVGIRFMVTRSRGYRGYQRLGQGSTWIGPGGPWGGTGGFGSGSSGGSSGGSSSGFSGGGGSFGGGGAGGSW